MGTNMPSSDRMAYLRTLAGSVAIAWSALAMSQALAAEQHDMSVIGQWKLTSVLDSADVSGLDDDEARKLVGTVLKISKSDVRVGGQVCSSPDFEVTSGDRDEYFKRRAHASAEKLGLPNPVTSVHINCAYVYKKTSDRLVLNWQGVFFDAVRQQAKHKN
jgi:hypothetical protein